MYVTSCRIQDQRKFVTGNVLMLVLVMLSQKCVSAAFLHAVYCQLSSPFDVFYAFALIAMFLKLVAGVDLFIRTL